MLMFGHFALGYLITLVFLKIFDFGLTSDQITLFLLIGAFVAIAPDLDFIPFFIKHKTLKLYKNGKSHRSYISHTPAFWLAVALLFYSVSQNEFLSLVILVASWSHFVGDSIEYGIMWFWPLSKRRYRLRDISLPEPSHKESIRNFYLNFVAKNYVRNWTFYAEFSVVLIALFIFLS